MEGRRLEMVADVDHLRRQAMRGGQAAAAAAASPPPRAAADVAAASTTPRPRHTAATDASATDTPALAFVAALAALYSWLPGPEKLDQNVAVSLGARPVERGKLCGIGKTPRKQHKRVRAERGTRVGMGGGGGVVGFEQQVERGHLNQKPLLGTERTRGNTEARWNSARRHQPKIFIVGAVTPC